MALWRGRRSFCRYCELDGRRGGCHDVKIRQSQNNHLLTDVFASTKGLARACD